MKSGFFIVLVTQTPTFCNRSVKLKKIEIPPLEGSSWPTQRQLIGNYF